MKTYALVCLLSVVLGIQVGKAQGSPGSPTNFVVVVGAFSVEANANSFVKHVKKQKLQAQVQFNEVKNLYYVGVLLTNDHDAAIAEAKRLQEAGPFRDAWVFNRTPAPPPVVEPVVVVEEKKKEVVIPVVVVPVKMSAADSARLAEEKIKEKVDNTVMKRKKGEAEKLDYIFFYRDAAVLRPESRFAVDKLVKIMNENPTEEIRIHGHTNGNDPGKIVKRSNANSDFFSLDNTVEGYGSAKELSQERSELIRDYLVSKGIDKKRMSIKAWGGKKPLFNVDDDRAEANVRVEIEVVKN